MGEVLRAEPARQPLRVLLVEDQPADAELVLRQLRRAGYEPAWRRVDSEGEYLAALEPTLDVILADFNMPQFGAQRALDLLKRSDLDVPLIVVSGSIGEETAVQVLKRGAADYLLKDRLARLGQAVQRALDERRLQGAKREVELALDAAEERTRFALDASRVGIWETDAKTGSARWSEMLERLHGLAPGTFGGTFDAFLAAIHPDDRAQVAAALETAARDRADANVLYRTEWPDGSIHWISGIGRTFYDEAGVPLRTAGIGLDVTQHRLLEEQYRQAQKMEAIGQLAGGVAHDFNNILMAIEGYSALLKEQMPADSRFQEFVSEIQLAAERAASLTRQLLAFSRRQMLEPRVIDLRQSLAAITPMLRRLIGENIEIVVRTTDDVGRVRADPGQIEQVILNLSVNARDAMPNGGTLVLEVADAELDDSYVRLHPTTPSGRYVMLAVSDTGTGMDAVTQAHVFEPFFTTKEQGKGTGLGLSTVYGIVQQSGGHVWLYSEIGRGTTFKVYLPRVEEAADTPIASERSAPLAGSETILICEDERSVRELLRRALSAYGYRLLVAGTPSEAVDLAGAEHGQIHLLLSDVILPQISGSTLAAKIVAMHPETRVMYMSGYTDNAIVHHGVIDGRTPFLQKPFTPEALARKIRDVLG